MRAVTAYIERKIKALEMGYDWRYHEPEYDRLVWALLAACRRHPDIVVDEDQVTASHVRDYYRAETEAGQPGERGCYLHILNADIPADNPASLAEFVRDFLDISGDVCFSDLCAGDDFLARRRSVIGVVLLATPVRSFPYDCWSQVDSRGRRYATRADWEGNPERSEHWIVPEQGHLVAIVYNERSEKLVRAAADKLGCTALDINWLQNEPQPFFWED